MSFSPSELLILSTPVLLACVAIFAWTQGRSQRNPELPGPKRLPIVGNWLSPKNVPQQMAAPQKEFGPIFSMQLFATELLVVTSVQVARELFETRSATYSNRLPMKMPEMCGFHEGILYQQDTSKLRQGRRLVAMGLSQRELDGYRHVVTSHSVTFLASILRTPENFLHHIRTLPVGFTLEMAYGYKVKGDNDPYVKRSEEWVEAFASATSVGDFLVNWFPILEYVPGFLPGVSFKKTAEIWKKSANEFSWDAYNAVKNAVARGDATPCVISRALIESADAFEDDVITYSAAQIITGGADTTVCTLATFILAMVLHPEVQEKGRAEIERVIGSNRLPTISDWDDLPYITSVVREVIRWHPAVPLLSRNPIKDDVYDGYFVPKDTMVVMNFWAMLHNEEFFPDHEVFRPERWSELKIDKDNDPMEIAFGFGRRVCPGRYSAKELLFTVIASMIAIFDISKAKDASGNLITPSEEFTNGGIVGPEPFKCKIEPRSEHARQIVEHAVHGLD